MDIICSIRVRDQQKRITLIAVVVDELLHFVLAFLHRLQSEHLDLWLSELHAL